MSQRRHAALATATVIALGLGLPAPTAAADDSTLYVNDAAGSNCSDSGAGTQAAPFCTIQAGADHAQPGQTVQVAAADYSEQVTLTHSGQPGKPINFTGGTIRDDFSKLPRLSGSDRGFALNGVHDINISGFAIRGGLENVLMTDAKQVTLNGNLLVGGQPGAAQPTDEVRMTGATSGVTVSRNIVEDSAGSGIVVDPGVTGTVITTNSVDIAGGGGGIKVTDASGTVINSNSVSSTCGPAVALLGNSSNAVVENNVLATSPYTGSSAPSCTPSQNMAKLSVSAASASGTFADYNLTNPFRGAPTYAWAGATYPDAPGFAKAVTGQGAHDITGDPLYSASSNTTLALSESSPAVDSADALAPGELDTDLFGFHRIDDPNKPNSGTGNGFHDRGAVELTSSINPATISGSQGRVPTGAAVTFAATFPGTWSPVVSATYDFGDGSAKATTTDSSVQHSYQVPGTYQTTAVLTLQNGDTVATPGGSSVTVSQPGPIVPKLTSQPFQSPLGYGFSALGSTSPWTLTDYSFDFGDGSAPIDNPKGTATHNYAREGDYTVTVTVTDAGGRTEKTTEQLHVAYQRGYFHPLAPARVLDTRENTNGTTTLGPGGSLKLPLGDHVFLPIGGNTATTQPIAVVLNVTAVPKNGDGHLSVYPAGSGRPQTSNVNFTAGVAVPNLVTVPVSADGAVEIANSYGGDVDVVADIFGFYTTQDDPASAETYFALQPFRLVDTRNGDAGGALGADDTRTIKVGGGIVPTDAAAVVLNLTATDATEDTYLTAFPGWGPQRPASSNLNPHPGQDVANQVIVPIATDGTIKIYNHTGHVNVVLDVVGFYDLHGGATFTPTTPTRVLDTRSNPYTKPGPDSTTVVNGLPSGADALVLNVTATDSTSPSYLTVYPHGEARPGTSNLNTVPGRDVPNQVITPPVPVGGSATTDIYNHAGSTDIVADLYGYFSH